MEGKKGFTIIELLIALVVVGTMFAGVVPLLFNSVNANKEARLRLIAYEGASQKLEEFREIKIPSLNASANTPFTIEGLPAGYTANYTVTKPKSPDQTLAQIAVHVEWTFNKRLQKVDLNTLLFGSTL